MDKEEKIDKMKCCCEGCDDCEDCKCCSGGNWKNKHWHHRGGNGGGGAVYGLGLIGAFIYYYQHSSVSADYIYGFLKALVWPAFLIHKVFTLLGM